MIGASLLQRTDPGAAEVLVMTPWESMAAIEGGADPERAVTEPEARAVLASREDVVTPHEIVSELGVGELCDAAPSKA